MLGLRYYCQGQGSEHIRILLGGISERHRISSEVMDLSNQWAYDQGKEREIYERDFKPRARLLKQRTGHSITSLRSRKARNYFVSLPGTIAIVSDDGVEWYTLGEGQISRFLRDVLEKGGPYLDNRRASKSGGQFLMLPDEMRARAEKTAATID